MSNTKHHWDGIYQNKSPLQQSWYQAEPRLSLRLIESTGLPYQAQIIDIGGGASKLVDRLLDKGYQNLSVLDISGRALNHARQRLAERSDRVRWIEEDVQGFCPDQTFDLWHDRAVFHFLTDKAARKKYLAVLDKALRPGGHLVIATFAIGGPKQCSGLEIVQFDAAKMVTELGNNYLFIEQQAECHLTPSGCEQLFKYFRFERRE